MTTQTQAVITRNGDQVIVADSVKKDVRESCIAWMDMASTATGKSTYYNTKKEQEDAMAALHDTMFGLNRGLYAAMLTLPGVLDNGIQTGISKLLSTVPDQDSFLTNDQEDMAVQYLADSLPPQRLLKMFSSIVDSKANGMRARKFMLRAILSSDNLEWWAVKYRTKMRKSLTHAWGRSKASALREITQKLPSKWLAKEKKFVAKYIDKYVTSDKVSSSIVYQSICFILGGTYEGNVQSKLIKGFYDAREDLEKGKVLPPEVLFGIRSTHHKESDKAEVYELTKKTQTDTQKRTSKRAARKVGVDTEVDWRKQDIVSLYIYAMEDGIDDDIREVMNDKARKIAETFPLKYDKVAIVVDTSGSMFGSKESKRRPAAISLAMRDVISASAKVDSVVFATNGAFDKYGMISVEGDTDLATPLVDALMEEPDAVFILSDGYENRSAGRVSEAMEQVRDMGNVTPVYQLSPVMASESVGVRQLSNEINLMPISNPSAIALSMLRVALESDIESGIAGLLEMGEKVFLPQNKVGAK